MRFQEFMADPAARARYWARSLAGWSRFASAAPNGVHRAVTSMEASGFVGTVVTQNVDGLHQGAGSRSVVELHGSLARVRCMECGEVRPRVELQHRMLSENPALEGVGGTGVRPDGDVVLPDELVRSFRPPTCLTCDGILKPDVVFFGEHVPRERVAASWLAYERARSLLVLGSSLTVFSGRRFVLRATRDAKPVAIVNRGPTRGDDAADLKIDAPLGEVMPALVHALRGSPAVS